MTRNELNEIRRLAGIQPLNESMEDISYSGNNDEATCADSLDEDATANWFGLFCNENGDWHHVADTTDTRLRDLHQHAADMDRDGKHFVLISDSDVCDPGYIDLIGGIKEYVNNAMQNGNVVKSNISEMDNHQTAPSMLTKKQKYVWYGLFFRDPTDSTGWKYMTDTTVEGMSEIKNAISEIEDDYEDMQTEYALVGSFDILDIAYIELSGGIDKFVKSAFNDSDDADVVKTNAKTLTEESANYLALFARSGDSWNFITDGDHNRVSPEAEALDDSGIEFVTVTTAGLVDPELLHNINALENFIKKAFRKGNVVDTNIIDESAPPGMEPLVRKLKKEYPGDESKAFATAWSIYDKKHGKKPVTEEVANVEVDAVISRYKSGEITYDEMQDELEGLKYTDYSMRQGEMGNPDIRDEMNRPTHDVINDFGFEDDEVAPDWEGDIDESLKNGSDDIHCARDYDYFPTGATSPVTSKVGPSGARQGDNPEQKRMAVTEAYKDLVYKYRKFISK